MAQPFEFARPSQSDQFNPQNLHSLIVEATPLARTLISSSRPPFIAIGTGSSGRTFVGFDVELPDLPPNFSIHAEQFLVVNLIRSEERNLYHLAISIDGYNYFSPCGSCFEFLQEISRGNELRMFIPGPQGLGFVRLDEMFPRQLNPYLVIRDQVHAHIPDVLQDCRNYSLFLESKCLETLKIVALEAAQRSHSPYTQAESGVALVDSAGKMYSGSFIESVNSTSSLGPVQAALIEFVMETRGREFGNISRAILVEKRGHFPQAETAKMILKKIAPGCTFEVFYFQN